MGVTRRRVQGGASPKLLREWGPRICIAIGLTLTLEGKRKQKGSERCVPGPKKALSQDLFSVERNIMTM